MQRFRNSQGEPDPIILAAATWLAAGLVLLGLTPLPPHDPRYGWSVMFWLLIAPSAVLAMRIAVGVRHAPTPVRLRSIRRRNSCMMRR